MVAWQGGDEEAFDRLVEGYSGRVYALLTRFLGRHPGREDLVQETFLRVVRARDRYAPTALFTTWLYSIVYHLAVNETQRRAGRTPVSIDQPPAGEGHDASALELVDDAAADPSDNLAREDVVQAVRTAIAALPETQRMALVLAKYEELSYSEIGTILGSSEKAIKSLIHRARETLRARLASFLEEEPA